MFGIQAILDTINQLSWHLITFGTCWPQEIPVEHTVGILYPLMQWKPHSCILNMKDNFDTKCKAWF